MEKSREQLYYKGYIAGYWDGLKDALEGKATNVKEKDMANLPVKAMGLSTRACNCLTRAGCTSLADVVSLSEYTILTMRNMGIKTTAEVAHWLDAHGIHYSVWSQYL